MQEAMESVKESLEQISGDGSSDMSQSWVHAQLSLAGELPHSACGFPITLSRVLDDGDMAVLEDLLQSTTGADGDASSSDESEKLFVNIQSGILWMISQCWVLHNKLSGAQLHAFFLASVVVFLVFTGFFLAPEGVCQKLRKWWIGPSGMLCHYSGLPSNTLIDYLYISASPVRLAPSGTS
ncbi:hypothetical protein EV401DRAFT_1894372 [Pisolithus croceorrhizus]|nr:hypothetical protein EV401DRAFT_1894372 [Pisolithus croceorrhizus]